jgi:acyl-CoA reductase-like NAD-dependent aldehyde dehydrogenase
MHVELLIAGHRVGGPCDQAIGKELARSPVDGSVIGTYAEGGWSELHTAITAADEAQKSWFHSLTVERSTLLLRMIEAIRDRRSELAEIVTQEIAKSDGSVEAEIDRVIKTFQTTFELLQDPDFDSVEDDKRGAFIRRDPRGVIFAITPFNFPLNLAAHKIAPALASRNALILKPSPKSALSTLTLALILQEAGIPDGLFNTWIGPNPLILKSLKDPRIKMLSFTGSADVGWKLRDQFPRLHMTLELGGDASAVIAPYDEISYEDHFEMVVSGAYSFAGQSCISTQHLWVHGESYDRWSNDLRKWVLEHQGFIQIDEDARKKFQATLQASISSGSVVTIGNYDHPAALIEHLHEDSPLYGNEAFAPLLVLHRYESISEAFRKIESKTNPIHVSLMCSHEDYDVQFLGLKSPGLLRNKPTNFRDDALPYGGSGKCGIGREGPRYAIEEMTELRTTYI